MFGRSRRGGKGERRGRERGVEGTKERGGKKVNESLFFLSLQLLVHLTRSDKLSGKTAPFLSLRLFSVCRAEDGDDLPPKKNTEKSALVTSLLPLFLSLHTTRAAPAEQTPPCASSWGSCSAAAARASSPSPSPPCWSSSSFYCRRRRRRRLRVERRRKQRRRRQRRQRPLLLFLESGLWRDDA